MILSSGSSPNVGVGKKRKRKRKKGKGRKGIKSTLGGGKKY